MNPRPPSVDSSASPAGNPQETPSIRGCSRDALGALVSERRRRTGMTQDGLARACELTTARVQRIELGALRRWPPTPELQRIAAALGAELADLLDAAGLGEPSAGESHQRPPTLDEPERMLDELRRRIAEAQRTDDKDGVGQLTIIGARCVAPAPNTASQKRTGGRP